MHDFLKPSRPRTGLLASAMLAGLLALPGAVGAAGPSTAASASAAAASASDRSTSRKATASRGAASATARVPLLSPAQVRDCMAQQKSMRESTDQALKDKESLAADRAALTKSEAALAEDLTTLDRTDPSQVEAYNAKAAERTRQVEAYQVKVTAFNAKADAVNASQAGYADTCANHRYDENQLTPATKKPKK